MMVNAVFLVVLEVDIMFGSREIRRKESGRRERLKNILFSIVWH
jgi:hypothetical protein